MKAIAAFFVMFFVVSQCSDEQIISNEAQNNGVCMSYECQVHRCGLRENERDCRLRLSPEDLRYFEDAEKWKTRKLEEDPKEWDNLVDPKFLSIMGKLFETNVFELKTTCVKNESGWNCYILKNSSRYIQCYTIGIGINVVYGQKVVVLCHGGGCTLEAFDSEFRH